VDNYTKNGSHCSNYYNKCNTSPMIRALFGEGQKDNLDYRICPNYFNFESSLLVRSFLLVRFESDQTVFLTLITIFIPSHCCKLSHHFAHLIFPCFPALCSLSLYDKINLRNSNRRQCYRRQCWNINCCQINCCQINLRNSNTQPRYKSRTFTFSH
jgi:hypothetical protein